MQSDFLHLLSPICLDGSPGGERGPLPPQVMLIISNLKPTGWIKSPSGPLNKYSHISNSMRFFAINSQPLFQGKVFGSQGDVGIWQPE